MSIRVDDYAQRQDLFYQMSSGRSAGIDISEIVKDASKDFFLFFAQNGMLFSKEAKAEFRQSLQNRLTILKNFFLLNIYRKALSDIPLAELSSQADQLEQQNKEQLTSTLQSVATNFFQNIF